MGINRKETLEAIVRSCLVNATSKVWRKREVVEAFIDLE